MLGYAPTPYIYDLERGYVPMTLLDSKPNMRYIITSIGQAPYDLQQRLYAMGLYEGSFVTLQYVSVSRDTYSFGIYGNQVALRKSEARLIEIEEHSS